MTTDKIPAHVRVGGWLKRRRETQLHRSLREAAEKARCSDAWLCQIETGKASIFHVRIGSISRLLAAYDLNLQTLLRLVGLLPTKGTLDES